jgi:hypothetical protein
VSQKALDSFLVELLGVLPRVDYRWAGIFGLTQDMLPLVGRVPGREGTWVAAGYSGHGNVLGFMCGRLVAAAIRGESDPMLDLFDPARLVQVESSVAAALFADRAVAIDDRIVRADHASEGRDETVVTAQQRFVASSGRGRPHDVPDIGARSCAQCSAHAAA